MVLYINSNVTCPLNTTILPNKNVSDCFAMLKANKDVKKFVILIHGFLNGFDTKWLHEMKDAIQKAESSTAVMVMVYAWQDAGLFTFCGSGRCLFVYKY